jgi:hypothetical protein
MVAAETIEALVPEGYKYAVRVMDTCFAAPTRQIEIAPGLLCLPGLPAELPSSWEEWCGTRELEKMRGCTMVFLAIAPSSKPEILDEENRALEDRLQRLHGALSITTPGYYVLFGRTIGGAHRHDYLDARTTGEVVRYWASPGTPKQWQVTERHLRHAAAVSGAFEAVRARAGGRTDRLVRILHAFHMGLSSQLWDVRLHQFCRVLDGLAATDRGAGRRQFGNRCCRMVRDLDQNHRRFFEQSFDTRGAIEHMRGPVEEIRLAVPELTTDGEAYVHMAYIAFVLEQVARHALLHVLETPELWPHTSDSGAAVKFWSDTTGLRERLWDAPLDVLRIQRLFDRREAEAVIGRLG